MVVCTAAGENLSELGTGPAGVSATGAAAAGVLRLLPWDWHSLGLPAEVRRRQQHAAVASEVARQWQTSSRQRTAADDFDFLFDPRWAPKCGHDPRAATETNARRLQIDGGAKARLVLCSDVLYERESFEPLARCLSALLAPAGAPPPPPPPFQAASADAATTRATIVFLCQWNDGLICSSVGPPGRALVAFTLRDHTAERDFVERTLPARTHPGPTAPRQLLVASQILASSPRGPSPRHPYPPILPSHSHSPPRPATARSCPSAGLTTAVPVQEHNLRATKLPLPPPVATCAAGRPFPSPAARGYVQLYAISRFLGDGGECGA